MSEFMRLSRSMVVGAAVALSIVALWLHLIPEAEAAPQAVPAKVVALESKTSSASLPPAPPVTPEKELNAEGMAWNWIARRHFIMKSSSIHGDLAHFEFEGANSCVIEMKHFALSGGPSGWLVSKDDCSQHDQSVTRK